MTRGRRIQNGQPAKGSRKTVPIAPKPLVIRAAPSRERIKSRDYRFVLRDTILVNKSYLSYNPTHLYKRTLSGPLFPSTRKAIGRISGSEASVTISEGSVGSKIVSVYPFNPRALTATVKQSSREKAQRSDRHRLSYESIGKSEDGISQGASITSLPADNFRYLKGLGQTRQIGVCDRVSAPKLTLALCISLISRQLSIERFCIDDSRAVLFVPTVRNTSAVIR
jgi:hypothetical protein